MLRRFRILPIAPIVLLLACQFAAPSMDHGLPGVSGTSADGLRMDFVGMMMGVLRGELDSWSQAVRRQGSTTLERHYASNASIVQPAASFLKGADAMRAFSEALAARAGDANASMIDVEVSDGIAYVYGAYFFQPFEAGQMGSSGRHVTVYRRTGADWRIRTQFFDPGPPATPFPGVAGSTEPASLELGTTDSGQVPRDAFVGAVTALAALRRAWADGNEGEVRRFFARDALLLLPDDESPRRGDAIADGVRTALGEFSSFDTTELDFTASGRLAVLVGSCALQARQGENHDGHYLAVLARDGRDWKIRSLVID